MTALPAAAAPAPAAPAAICLEGITAAYRSRDVLRDLDLTIARGERVAILGPNGAGKSTLLRVAAGILRPKSGRAELLGAPIAGLDRAAIARRLALVPQAIALPFSMRVSEVVALGRLPHENPFRGPGADDAAFVRDAMGRVGIQALADRDVRELSLGERQLVALALVVAQAAPIVLLDEPTVHLDLRHQVEAMELLVDLNERDGHTVVSILHDLRLAARFFPRLVLVAQGRIVADGAPADVLTDGAIRAVFGIDPAIVRSDAVPFDHAAREP